MATKVEKPLEASQLTHVADMPPLDVVTAGIPDQEHLELPPSAPPAPPVARERRGRMWAWALAGVMGLLLVVAGVLAFTQYSSTGDLDLTVVPPVGADVGEPASDSAYSGVLEGPALPYMYAPIPAIPSIADVSIAPIPAIPPMPAMSIPPITEISIPSNPAAPPAPTISVPSIPAMSAISFPSFPAIPTISVPSIPPFPAMSAISVPSIPPIPGISFPTFPAM